MLVMYVEDHYEDQIFVRRVVEAMGHEVIGAGTGLDSLEIAAERQTRFDPHGYQFAGHERFGSHGQTQGR